MDLPLLKNDITNKLGPQKPAINSSNMQSGLVTCSLEISQMNSSELKHWQGKNVSKIKKELFVQDAR